MTHPFSRPFGTAGKLLRGAALAVGLGAASLAAGVAPALAQSGIIQGQGGWLFPGWESLSVLDKAGIARTIGLLKDTQTALAAKNIKLLPVVVPLKASFYTDKLPDGTKISAEIAGQYDYILAELKKARLDTVDLRPALKSVQTGKQVIFYRADYHWSVWSAEAAADAVAQAIKASGVKLAGAAGSGDKLGSWVTQRHLGDLAERFLTPDQQKQVGPDLYTVRMQPEAKGGLVDTASAPVHVVGNSFVQPYLGFPQKLSSALDRPVALTWNPGNVGPWVTFLQFTSAPDFARNPPQVVVWQFNEGPFHSAPEATDQWDASSIMTAQQFRDRMQAAVGK
ncbi:alginate O-acetyltransferase AlgX-related protein [Xanthobacter agilis]|uniref:Alginate O-acetyltransferase complex protein AlgJ n=1 Tax=Xanthobacter agilis TaxID=47492 RepID=A0ABU0LF36_XANAG|nr:twin-arginine translocation pathway signal [Xanthobacter agilis]MDQ0505739.1 alginate O-acetyltransferase complex protein AlgJ [Xanthobacter agilis]